MKPQQESAIRQKGTDHTSTTSYVCIQSTHTLSEAQQQLVEASERETALIIPVLRDAGYADLADRLEGCPQKRFPKWYGTPETPGIDLIGGCGVPLLCPFCARQRSRRYVKKYGPRFLAAIESGAQAAFVTLTVPNSPDLSGATQRLVDGIGSLLKERRRDLRRKVHRTELSRILGGTIALDLNYRDGDWGPHAHGLFVVEGSGPRLNSSGLSQCWLDATGDAHIVEAAPLRLLGSSTAAKLESIKRPLYYSTKLGYPHKGDPGLAPTERLELYRLLHGQKLILPSWGCIRGPPP